MYGTSYVNVDYRVSIKCDFIAPWCCWDKFPLCNPQNNNSAEHDIILESYAKINCRLEIPHKNYIAHCNTVPNNTTIANASSKIKSVSGYDPF